MIEGPDPELADHLRQGAGRELREEAAEDERLTELLRRRRLDLGGRLLESVHRGERVRAETGSHNFAGLLVYAGADFATVQRADDVVEVVLAAAVWTVESSPTGGVDQTGEPLTFRARLAEIASTPETVIVALREGRNIVGSIDVVTGDHLDIDQDGSTVLVPLALVTAVIRSSPRS